MASQILDWIASYSRCKMARMHTPGHKGKLGIDFSTLDITELGLDGHVFPNNLVNDAQSRASQYFGCRHTRLLTNGSSIGIKAAIMAIGGDIIIGSDSHQAVAEGLELSNRHAIIVANTCQNTIPMPLTPEQVECAIASNPTAAAVLITSPTYYGHVANIETIRAITTRHNKLLIVDSAHGAHFAASTIFPITATKYADIANCSGHKTMNVLTQGAYLCINNDALLSGVDQSLRLLGTTSPSYIILGSLEYAIEYAINHSDDYLKLVSLIAQFKIEFIGYYCSEIVACEALGLDIFVPNDDPTRLVVDSAALGLTGHELADRERQRNIECEKQTDRHLIYIFSLADLHEHMHI